MPLTGLPGHRPHLQVNPNVRAQPLDRLGALSSSNGLACAQSVTGH